ncbi:MAG: CRISPR-associated endonuclease Cas1 [Desulfovibrionaceae bacterium]|nr:CRISPR-associated endonuclease Cas1 [Desulfovibrionaceae bacterium]
MQYEDPIAAIDAQLKYAMRTSKLTWIIRPNTQKIYSFSLNYRYCVTLVFPECSDPNIVTDFVSALRNWFGEKSRLFSFEKAEKPVVMTLNKALIKQRKAHPNIQNANCLKLSFINRLYYTAPKGWEGNISCTWLAKACIRRIIRCFGAIETDAQKEEIKLWNSMRIIPWFCTYTREKDGTGFCRGPIFIEGPVSTILSGLTLASHTNIGARLNAGQGAFTISPYTIADSEFDGALTKEETWIETWAKLTNYVPNIPRDLPEGKFESILERIEAKEWRQNARLDMLLGLGIYTLLAEGLAHAQPMKNSEWANSLPWLPKDPDFLKAVRSILPSIDAQIPNLIERLQAQTQETVYRTPHPQEDAREKPEEASKQNDTKASGTPPLKRPCYILRDNAAVTVSDDKIYSRYDGKIIGHVPLGHVSMLVLQNAGSVSVPLIKKCLQREIPVLLTGGATGKFQSIILPENALWTEVGDAQLRHWDRLGEEGRVRIGIFFLMAKIQNYITCLNDSVYGQSIKRAGINALKKLEHTTDRGGALSYEGNFAKVSFSAILSLIKNPGFSSKARVPHRRLDAFNCFLDVLSSLVFNRIRTLLCIAGLSPFRGYMHCQHDRYATLAADIQELFRARTESWLVVLLNEKRFDTTYLKQSNTDGTWSCTQEGWGVIVEEFERELNTCRFAEKQTWLSYMEEQIQKLKQWYLGEKELAIYRGGTWWKPPTQKL